MRCALFSFFFVFSIVAFDKSGVCDVTIDFSSWTGDNSVIDDEQTGWIFTFTLNGDGTYSVVSNDSAVGVGATGGNDMIAVTGTTTSTATGTFTVTVDGTNASGADTTTQIRTTGLGVTGRNAGRIDYNAVVGDPGAEVLDITVDMSGTSNIEFVLTSAALESFAGGAIPVFAGFDSSNNQFDQNVTVVELGGVAFTTSGTSTTFASAAYDSANGPTGFSLSSLSFDIVDTTPQDSQILIQFDTWQGGFTEIADAPTGWEFVFDFNGDGTFTVTDSSAAVNIDQTGGPNSIAVIGATNSSARGSVTVTFDGTGDQLQETSVNLQTTGLGVTGRSASRIDFVAPFGATTSEVMDVVVDATDLVGGNVVVTGACFGNSTGNGTPVLTDFLSGMQTFDPGTQSASLGGVGNTVDAGDSATMLFAADFINSVEGYSLGSFNFEIVDNGLLVGDVNCDGQIDFADIPPFIVILSNGLFDPKADINSDGVVDFADIGPFIDLLIGG